MKKSELKKVLKPLIKECIKEVLLEETGVLAKVVSEVASGMGQQIIAESSQPKTIERPRSNCWILLVKTLTMV